MSYTLKILKDHPLSFWKLDETFGDTAIDYSGCGNNGVYTGICPNDILPITTGTAQSFKVTDTEYITYNIINDYTGSVYDDHFGTKYSSDADFTIEAWFYPKIISTNLTPIVADMTNSVGLFYQNGNITFKLDSEELSYTLPDLDRAFHIVGVYSIDSVQLYINGYLAINKSLSSVISNLLFV